MKSFIVAAIFIVASSCPAQTAKVIQLPPEIAKKAEALYKERAMVNEQIEALHKAIEETYLSDVKPGPGNTFIAFDTTITTTCGMTLDPSAKPCPPETAAERKAREAREAAWNKQHHLERRPGWADFEFSEDFKFIVPKVATFMAQPYSCGIWSNGYYSIPAYH
jgi:hypothetical protein